MRCCRVEFAGRARLLPIVAVAVLAAISDGRAEPVAAPADPVAESRAELADKLRNLKSEAEASAERQTRLDRDLASLQKDERSLTDELVRAGERLRRLEKQALSAENRLAALADDEARLRASLDDKRHAIGRLLAGLQRIGRQPPPAIVVRSDHALESVRGAILLRAALPSLSTEAEALGGDLREMSRLRAEMDTEWRRLSADLEILAEDRARLRDLIEEKRRRRASSAFELEAERRRAQALARQVGTVAELLSGAATLGPRQEPSRESGAIRPPIAFDALRGRLPMLVAGTVLRDFGTRLEDGSPAEGVVIAAASNSTVFTPADGTVAYSGPFRSYGRLLILDMGEGYHVVMAGFGELHASVGQVVVSGEPIGQMGSEKYVSAATLGIQSARPTLYVEFRKDGAAIDPAPWWAADAVVSQEVGG